MTPEELNAKAELIAGLMEDGQHYDAAQEIPGIIAHARRLQKERHALADVIREQVAGVESDADDWTTIVGAVAGLHGTVAAFKVQIARLQDILDCEQGKRAPEGWTWDQGECWVKGDKKVRSLRHGFGWEYGEFPDYKRAPTALEALEAAEKVEE